MGAAAKLRRLLFLYATGKSEFELQHGAGAALYSGLDVYPFVAAHTIAPAWILSHKCTKINYLFDKNNFMWYTSSCWAFARRKD